MGYPIDLQKQFDRRAGFNLILLCLMLLVSSLIIVAVLPGGRAGNNALKAVDTVTKLGTVEQKMLSFMAKNGRRPCPADGKYDVNDPTGNFGVEAANQGSCTGGTPAAPLTPAGTITLSGATKANPVSVSASGHGLMVGSVVTISGVVGMVQLNGTFMVGTVPDPNSFTLTDMYGSAIDSTNYTAYGGGGTATVDAVGGVIPTKTLGLDDSYAFDEFGRRITYVVDPRATAKASCLSLEGVTSTNQTPKNKTGGITIENTTGGTVLDHTMAAYISHGPDGHGAWPPQGGTTRMNSGTTDPDEITNASVNSSFSPYFTNVMVQKPATTTFGDVVYYADYLKNNCCVGGAANCTIPGFRVNGTTNGGQLGFTAVMGDVNGDGIPDLILGEGPTGGCCYWNVYVIFGTKSGFPNPLPSSGSLASYLNGTNGFTLTSGGANNIASAIKVGDIDNDGYADIILGTGARSYTRPAVYVFYGHAGPFAASYNLDAMTACQGFVLTSGNGGSALGTAVGVGDVNGDGVKDIVATDWAVGPAATGTVTFTTNPSNNQTIILAGTTWTFVTSGASGSQTNIQGTLAATLTQLASDLNAYGTPYISWASYSASATVLTVTYKSGGSSGNFYTLAVGTAASAVSGATLSGGDNNGAAYVVFGQTGTKTCPGTGSVNGTATSIDVTTLTNASNPKGAVINNNSATSSFGGANGANNDGIPIADINGDGINDIIIPDTYYYDDVGAYGAWPGRLVIVAGQTTWPSVINVGSLAGIAATSPGPACAAASTSCGLTIYGNANFDSFLGSTLAAGDVTGDGIADIAAEGGDNAGHGGGRTDVIIGSALAWPATYPDSSGPASPAGAALTFTAGGGGGMGSQVAIGDVNGDGKADLLIADNTITAYGSVYVLFGPLSASRDVVSSPLTGTDGFRIDCPYQDNYNGAWTPSCGNALGVGDINGDGVNDMVIGVSGGNVTGTNLEGYTYVLYGKKTGWPATYNLSTIY